MITIRKLSATDRSIAVIKSLPKTKRVPIEDHKLLSLKNQDFCNKVKKETYCVTLRAKY